MANHSYPVEVKSDFLEHITRAKPLQALAELIWNSLDADATRVDVTFESNNLGALSKIIISDNGIGMEHQDAPELFKNLGGSWKRPGGMTKKEKRFLHGQDGQGRFKVFALGGHAEWSVTYQKKDQLSFFTITMANNKIDKVVISDEVNCGSQDLRLQYASRFPD